MEVPELVRQQLGREELQSAVSIGDEDLVCFTPSRTLIYRSEGLISDDSLETYNHDVERLDVSEGRRKTTFTLEYVDRTEKFSVPSGRGEPVLERLLGGVLGTGGVLDAGEEVVGVYQFSELTLIIAESRLVKQIGGYIWDEEYEEYPYSDVTGLAFEEGSVATQIVLSVKGRPQRIKAPNDQAPMVRQTLTRALFEFHDVASLAQLNETVGQDDEQTQTNDANQTQSTRDLALDDSISPLVGEDDDLDDVSGGLDDSFVGDSAQDSGDAADPNQQTEPQQPHTQQQEGSQQPHTQQQEGSQQPHTQQQEGSQQSKTQQQGGSRQPNTRQQGGSQQPNTQQQGGSRQERTQSQQGQASPGAPGTQTRAGGIDPEEFQELQGQVQRLTSAVQRQNEVLEQQHKTIQQLVNELNQQ